MQIHSITGQISHIKIHKFGEEANKKEYVTAILTMSSAKNETPQELFLLSFFQRGIEYLKTLKENDTLNALAIYENIPKSTKPIVSILSSYTNNPKQISPTKIRRTKHAIFTYKDERCWSKIKLIFSR